MSGGMLAWKGWGSEPERTTIGKTQRYKNTYLEINKSAYKNEKQDLSQRLFFYRSGEKNKSKNEKFLYICVCLSIIMHV